MAICGCTWKITRHLIGFLLLLLQCLLYHFVNENFFRAFLASKSQYVCNKFVFQTAQQKEKKNKNCEVAFRHGALIIYLSFSKSCFEQQHYNTKNKIKKSHENKYRGLILWLHVSNTWTGKKERICKTYLWLVWIAVTALPNKASIHPTAKLH